MALTKSSVASRVTKIARVERDQELASQLQYDLWEEVLEQAASGGDVTELARIALRTRNMVDRPSVAL